MREQELRGEARRALQGELREIASADLRSRLGSACRELSLSSLGLEATWPK